MLGRSLKLSLATIVVAAAAALGISVTDVGAEQGSLEYASAEQDILERTSYSPETLPAKAPLVWPSTDGYRRVDSRFVSMNDHLRDVYTQVCYGTGERRRCEDEPIGVEGVSPDLNDDNGLETQVDVWTDGSGNQLSFYCLDREVYPEESRPAMSETRCRDTRYAVVVMPAAGTPAATINSSYWLVDENCSGSPTKQVSYSRGSVHLPRCLDSFVNRPIIE